MTSPDMNVAAETYVLSWIHKLPCYHAAYRELAGYCTTRWGNQSYQDLPNTWHSLWVENAESRSIQERQSKNVFRTRHAYLIRSSGPSQWDLRATPSTMLLAVPEKTLKIDTVSICRKVTRYQVRPPGCRPVLQVSHASS